MTVKNRRYWTYTGRFAFYTKTGAEQFVAAIEDLLEDPDRVAGIISGNGYLIQQPMRPRGHVIRFARDGWTIQHSIECDVMACRLPKLAAKLKAPPVPFGRYYLFYTNGKMDIGNRIGA